MAKQDEYARITIRIPPGLYERIVAAAGERSLNATIIEALESRWPEPVGDTLNLSRLVYSARSGGGVERRRAIIELGRFIGEAGDRLITSATGDGEIILKIRNSAPPEPD